MESASYGNSAFFLAGDSTPYVIVDGEELRLPRNVMEFQDGPGYFRTMGIPLLAGRDFTAADVPGAPAVVVVSSAFARRFWPGGSALGHRVSVPPDMSDAVVVGVADDTNTASLDESGRLAVFAAWKQQARIATRTGILVRSDRPNSVLAALRREIPAVDASVPVGPVRVLQDVIGRAFEPQRLGSWLLGAFGVIALVLAVVGIHGLVAFLVAQRTHEIGVRMALGASHSDIVRLVLIGVLRAVTAGVAAGAAAVWWLAAFADRLLIGVSPHDPVALTWTVGLLMLAAIAGAAIPARRAARVDPMIALRAE